MFQIQFKTDNAAFEDSPASEVARILREVADKIEDGASFEGRVRDCNGNTIGSFELKE